MIRRLLVVLAVVLSTTPAFAVNPDEVLADPGLEARARAISAELRCMVCQNQSIDDSNAELAKDLRLLVRERLTDGDTDEQVINYIVSRYGEFVLLKPRVNARTILLWAGPLLLAGVASGVLVAVARGTRGKTVVVLSDEENAELERLLAAKFDGDQSRADAEPLS
ncbi:cytochrome c-type biogenesis protein [Rhizobium sp. YTU87027]|uniref:cytochrome c-type biogenesis protein n=1 Tax=Rhizobium sp. YTU87027 TaxID=3417741 RepID=UPI003D683E78